MDEVQTNHSTSNLVTSDNEKINDENEGDDFEDGEIPDDDEEEIKGDDDDDVIIINDSKNDIIEESKSNKKTKDQKILNNKIIDLSNDQKELNNIKKSKKKKDSIECQDDFAGNIEHAIAAALKKDGIEPPLPKLLEKRKVESNKTDLLTENDFVNNDDTISINKRKQRKRQRKREKLEKEEKQNKNEKAKKSKIDIADDLIDEDDFEMLCVRGGSPPRSSYSSGLAQKTKYYEINDTSSYESDSSNEYHSKRKKQNRKSNRDNKRRDNRGGDNDSTNNGVCIVNFRGQCSNDDCQRSHDARAPRKLELCKFYLMECCAKRDKCSYMHSDFPCKYYYLGMECIYKQTCKFSHGKPLTEYLRHILLKHIETAPKEILGPFKRISREHAVNLLLKQHEKLCDEYSMENNITQAQIQSMLLITKQNYIPANLMGAYDYDSAGQNNVDSIMNLGGGMNQSGNMNQSGGMIQTGGMNQTGCMSQTGSSGLDIPSLLDMVIKPPSIDDAGEQQGQNQLQSNRQRKSRWADNSTNNNKTISQNLTTLQKKLPALNPTPVQKFNGLNKYMLNLRMLSNILNQEQIEKLESLGVENLEQLSQLNLLQLNHIGLTANQINEIQLNAMSMEKLGIFQGTSSNTIDIKVNTADVDSMDSEKTATLNEINEEDGNKQSIETPFIVDALKATTTDVDMRFLPSTTQSSIIPNHDAGSSTSIVGSNKLNTAVDYSQYLKDSNLDYGNMERNDFPDDDEKLVIEEEESELRIDESWGQDNDTDTNKGKDNDEKVTSTLKSRDFDDDGNSSSSSQDAHQLKLPPAIYDPIKLLNNNSKKKIIDLSSTVTNMLQAEAKAAEEQFSYKAAALFQLNQNKQLPSQDQDDRPTKICDFVSDIDEKINMSMSMNMNMNLNMNMNNSFYSDFRDPRKSKQLMLSDSQQSPKLSRPRSISPIKSPTCELPLYERTSIYDGNLDENSAESPQSPTSSSGKCDKDMRMSSFMDSTSSDIDLRLPFKSMMDNYIPATEIDGGLGSHGPILYRVHIVDVPKPSYKEIRRSIPVNEKTSDPRLRRIFCLRELPQRNQIGSSSSKSNASTRKDSFDAFNSGQSGSDSEASSPYPTFSGSSLFHQQQSVSSTRQKENANATSLVMAPRLDPRRRQQEASNQNSSTNSNQTTETPVTPTDLRMLLQNSKWYKDLNSKHKIMVNQQFAIISTELKKFQQNTDPDKIFDLKFILENQMLQQILTNLGIFINEQGEVKQIELSEYEQTACAAGQIGGGIANRPPPIIDSSIPPPTAQSSIPGMEFLRGPPPIPQRFPTTHQPPAIIHMPPPIAFNPNLPANPNLMQLPPDMRPGLLGVAPGMGYNQQSNFNDQLMNSGPNGSQIRPGINNDCMPGGLQFDQQNFQQFQQNNNQFQQRPMGGRFNNFNNNNNNRYPNRLPTGNNFNNNNNNFNNSNFQRNGGGN